MTVLSQGERKRRMGGRKPLYGERMKKLLVVPMPEELFWGVKTFSKQHGISISSFVRKVLQENIKEKGEEAAEGKEEKDGCSCEGEELKRNKKGWRRVH